MLEKATTRNVLDKCRTKNKKVVSQKIESDTNCNFLKEIGDFDTL